MPIASPNSVIKEVEEKYFSFPLATFKKTTMGLMFKKTVIHVLNVDK